MRGVTSLDEFAIPVVDGLDGTSALVIGGTSGIGRATALLFARSGARVAIAGRAGGAGEATVQAIRKLGSEALYFAVDVQDGATLDAAVEGTVAAFGRLDCAFNNAGWEGNAGPVEELAESDWLKMIDLKLSGVWRGMRAQIAAMRRLGGGCIVNMAGNWGLVGFPNFASYCAAAHGIVGLTRAAALEVAAAGIRVNAVCPGAVDAPMLDRMVGGDEGVKRSFGEQLAIGRIATADEVAAAVVWLSSPQSSYVNGVALPIDGGG